MIIGANWSRWTDLEDARLKAACATKRPAGIKQWEIVAKEIPGRSALACAARWKLVGAREQLEGTNPNGDRVRTWDQDEAKIAFDIWQECFGEESDSEIDIAKRHRAVRRIADELKRDYGSVSQRLKRFGATFGFNQASRKQASAEAITDMVAREAARRQRSLTGDFFGDPPPGFSALDQKRNATPKGENHASHY